MKLLNRLDSGWRHVPTPWSTDLSPSSNSQPARSSSGENRVIGTLKRCDSVGPYFVSAPKGSHFLILECLGRPLIGKSGGPLAQEHPLEAMRTGFEFRGTLAAKAGDGHKSKLVDEPQGTEIWGT